MGCACRLVESPRAKEARLTLGTRAYGAVQSWHAATVVDVVGAYHGVRVGRANADLAVFTILATRTGRALAQCRAGL